MDSSDLYQEIEDADRAFEANFNRQDADGMARLYTQNGQLLPPGSDVVTDRDEIAGFWQGIFDMGIVSAQLETVEVENHGKTAIEIGRFTLSDADEQTVDHGTFLVVWKYDGGEWKLHRDIWNSNNPDGA
jgi:ketosteroid isomerase-like protein